MLQAELFLASYSCAYIHPAASLLKICVKHSNLAQHMYPSWFDQKSGALRRGSFTEMRIKLRKSTKNVAANRTQKSKKLLPSLALGSEQREQHNHTPQKRELPKGACPIYQRDKSLGNCSGNWEGGESLSLLLPAECLSCFPLAASDRKPEIQKRVWGSS